MFQLYLIGGIVIAAIIGVLSIWVIAKKAGRREEQFKNMKEDITNVKKVNQIKSANASKSSDDIRKRLRKRLKN